MLSGNNHLCSLNTDQVVFSVKCSVVSVCCLVCSVFDCSVSVAIESWGYTGVE